MITKELIIEYDLHPSVFDDDDRLDIDELGLRIWETHIIELLGEKLVAQIFEYIHQDRNGASGQDSTIIIRGVLDSFVYVRKFKREKYDKLKIYVEKFEIPFLQVTDEYMQKESKRLFSEYTLIEYMEKVSQFRDEEYLRCTNCFLTRTFVQLRTIYEQYMVCDHLSKLLGECHLMVVKERWKQLALLYGLVKSLPEGLPHVQKEVCQYFKEAVQRELPKNSAPGSEASTSGNPKNYSLGFQFFESIFVVHVKYKKLIEEFFKGDSAFIEILDKTCSQFIIDKAPPNCRYSELLARYCDSFLRKSSKPIPEPESEEKLSWSVGIFKFIDHKEIFQRFYCRFLAKRLLHGQSQCMDAEEAMINRFKRCASSTASTNRTPLIYRQIRRIQFMNKLRRMYTDTTLSVDLNNKFNNYIKEDNFGLGFNFSVQVLQTNVWPLGKRRLTSLVIPQELQTSVQKFESFYQGQFSGRKLTWLHHLCQGELKLTYLNKLYLITMETFQMAILLLFEKTDYLTVKYLAETLQLDSDHFAKHVESLLKFKLLISNTSTILPETILTLNMEYSNKRTKLKINGPLQQDFPQEVKQKIGRVDEERKMYLNTLIVRIMKDRKTLKHNALIQKVISQSKASFSPSVRMIKKCIESLIDKEYIARTPNSSDEYVYVT